MKIHGVEFEITENCVDKHKIEVVPGVGAIMPILLERVNGFYDYLVMNRCIRKDKIRMVYIFSANTYEGALCVEYLDGSVAVIQDVGEVEFCQNCLT